MKATMILLATALFIPSIVACGDDEEDDGGGGNTTALCQSACEKSAALDCAGDDPDTCVSDCEAELGALIDAYPNCSSQLRATLSCWGGRPESDWECDADDEAAVKAGVCDDEQTAVGTCISGG